MGRTYSKPRKTSCPINLPTYIRTSKSDTYRVHRTANQQPKYSTRTHGPASLKTPQLTTHQNEQKKHQRFSDIYYCEFQMHLDICPNLTIAITTAVLKNPTYQPASTSHIHFPPPTSKKQCIRFPTSPFTSQQYLHNHVKPTPLFAFSPPIQQ